MVLSTGTWSRACRFVGELETAEFVDRNIHLADEEGPLTDSANRRSCLFQPFGTPAKTKRIVVSRRICRIQRRKKDIAFWTAPNGEASRAPDQVACGCQRPYLQKREICDGHPAISPSFGDQFYERRAHIVEVAEAVEALLSIADAVDTQRWAIFREGASSFFRPSLAQTQKRGDSQAQIVSAAEDFRRAPLVHDLAAHLFAAEKVLKSEHRRKLLHSLKSNDLKGTVGALPLSGEAKQLGKKPTAPNVGRGLFHHPGLRLDCLSQPAFAKQICG
jgi:hypothetical protein